MLNISDSCVGIFVEVIIRVLLNSVFNVDVNGVEATLSVAIIDGDKSADVNVGNVVGRSVLEIVDSLVDSLV